MAVREWWKQYYRRLRIARRESLKASMDAMIWGTGVMAVPYVGDPHHVPFLDFYQREEEGTASAGR